MNQSAAEWPERIHYVCNSGSGIVVNASPPVQAGAKRVVGMTILCAVGKQSRPTPAEERESIGPKDRLTRFARERLGVEARPVFGPPDSHKAWTGLLDKEAARAAERNATLVYNLTGGPRALPLAVLLGASNAARAATCAISVSFADRTCKRLVFDDQGVLVDERPLPAHERIGFDDLLPLYGYQEQQPDQRRAGEEHLLQHSGVAERVLEASLGWWDIAAKEWVVKRKRAKRAKGQRQFGRSIVSKLHKLVHELMREGEPPFMAHRSEIRNSRNSRAIVPVFESFEGLEGLDVVRNSEGLVENLEIRSEAAARFVGGVWLEAAILGRVRRAMSHVAGAEVVAGARIRVDGSKTRAASDPPDDSEIDVAIVVNEQLHVIEAKAVGESSKIGYHVARLVKIRQELGSQVMRCFLVAPLLGVNDLARGDFVTRAKKQGVDLLYGRSALNDLEREIAALAQVVRASGPASGGSRRRSGAQRHALQEEHGPILYQTPAGHS